MDVEDIESGGKLFSSQQGNQVHRSFEAKLAKKGKCLEQMLIGLLAKISIGLLQWDHLLWCGNKNTRHPSRCSSQRYAMGGYLVVNVLVTLVISKK